MRQQLTRELLANNSRLLRRVFREHYPTADGTITVLEFFSFCQRTKLIPDFLSRNELLWILKRHRVPSSLSFALFVTLLKLVACYALSPAASVHQKLEHLIHKIRQSRLPPSQTPREQSHSKLRSPAVSASKTSLAKTVRSPRAKRGCDSSMARPPSPNVETCFTQKDCSSFQGSSTQTVSGLASLKQRSNCIVRLRTSLFSKNFMKFFVFSAWKSVVRSKPSRITI